MAAKLGLSTHLCCFLILLDCTLVYSVDTLSTTVPPSATDVHDTKITSLRTTGALVHRQVPIPAGLSVVKGSGKAEERMPKSSWYVEGTARLAHKIEPSLVHRPDADTVAEVVDLFEKWNLHEVKPSNLFVTAIFKKWFNLVREVFEQWPDYAIELIFNRLLKYFGYDASKFAIHLVNAKFSSKNEHILRILKDKFMIYWNSFDLNPENLFTSLHLVKNKIKASDPVVMLWNEYVALKYSDHTALNALVQNSGTY